MCTVYIEDAATSLTATMSIRQRRIQYLGFTASISHFTVSCFKQ